MEKQASFTMAGIGQLVVNIRSTERCYGGNEITVRGSEILCSGAGGCAFEEKELTLTCQRYVTLDA